MEFKLKTPDVQKQGHTAYQIRFSMETVNESFRDNVLGMILAALDGGTAQCPEPPEEKQPALGFHKEDEDD